MFCQKCGTEVSEEAVYCLKCGYKLLTRSAPRISNGALWLAAIAAAVSIGAALISILPRSDSTSRQDVSSNVEMAVEPDATLTPSPSPSPKPSPSATPKPSPRPSPPRRPTGSAEQGTKNNIRAPEPEPQQGDVQPARPRAQTIVRDSFTVNAGRFVFYPIPPNLNGAPVRVTGLFEAKGGRNDIECYIMDEVGFTNFKNGLDARTYFNSGRATVGNIHAVISPRGQNYYVVFNNAFSSFTSKSVKASVIAFYLGQ